MPGPESQSHSICTKMVDAGGYRLRVAHWRLREPSQHPPLLFFNGIGANIEAVAPLAERLSERTFITFDMPGIGRSPDPVLPYNPVTMAWTANRVLDLLEIGRVDLMGFSWGGALAQQFAIQQSSRIRRLVLAGTFGGMFMVPGDVSILARMMHRSRSTDTEIPTENIMSLYGKAAPRRHHRNFVGRLIAPSSRGFLYQMAAVTGWTSLPFLPLITAPTLVLTGDEDQIVPPANAIVLSSAIPNAELSIIEGSGHLFMLTHIDETLARLRAFLDA